RSSATLIRRRILLARSPRSRGGAKVGCLDEVSRVEALAEPGVRFADDASRPRFLAPPAEQLPETRGGAQRKRARLHSACRAQRDLETLLGPAAAIARIAGQMQLALEAVELGHDVALAVGTDERDSVGDGRKSFVDGAGLLAAQGEEPEQ